MAKADLTEAYQNSAFIPDGDTYPDKWAEDAFDFRQVEHAIGRARLNLPYGSQERQALDLFLPAGRPVGLVVFVHGGYWMEGDRSYWSHFANGATKAGWAVAIPSYTLAPEARISNITAEIAAAIGHAASLVSGPIRLTGHSAGGHLVARMNCTDVDLPETTAARIDRIVPISPLSDLRPLMQTDMNGVLAIDAAEAEAESPVSATARRGINTQIWVGSNERPVFLDQARWLAEAWPEAEYHVADGYHHFDIIDLLHGPDGAILRSLID
jgi:acetyl esterase/lipase